MYHWSRLTAGELAYSGAVTARESVTITRYTRWTTLEHWERSHAAGQGGRGGYGRREREEGEEKCHRACDEADSPEGYEASPSLSLFRELLSPSSPPCTCFAIIVPPMYSVLSILPRPPSYFIHAPILSLSLLMRLSLYDHSTSTLALMFSAPTHPSAIR